MIRPNVQTFACPLWPSLPPFRGTGSQSWKPVCQCPSHRKSLRPWEDRYIGDNRSDVRQPHREYGQRNARKLFCLVTRINSQCKHGKMHIRTLRMLKVKQFELHRLFQRTFKIPEHSIHLYMHTVSLNQDVYVTNAYLGNDNTIRKTFRQHFGNI